MKTIHPKIFIGKIAPRPHHQVLEIVNSIPPLCGLEDEVEIRRLISKWLPEARLTQTEQKTTSKIDIQPIRVEVPMQRSMAA